MRRAHMRDAEGDHLAQHGLINIRKTLDIKAGLARAVLAKLGKHGITPKKAAGKINAQGRLARRKTGDGCLAAMAAVIAIDVFAKTDDGRPP